MPPPGNSEEERMRRFLEALGIPADSAAPQRGPNPTPLRQPAQPPPKRRENKVPPVPPIIARDYPRKRSEPPPMPVSQRPTSTRSPEPLPYEQRTLDSAPAPTTAAARIQLPDLEVTRVEEFHTVSSAISAAPSIISPLTTEEAKAKELADQQRESDRELWKVALRSPEAQRSAFILSEIFGPPRGLQT